MMCDIGELRQLKSELSRVTPQPERQSAGQQGARRWCSLTWLAWSRTTCRQK